jgi:hypothetical protein
MGRIVPPSVFFFEVSGIRTRSAELSTPTFDLALAMIVPPKSMEGQLQLFLYLDLKWKNKE